MLRILKLCQAYVLIKKKLMPFDLNTHPQVLLCDVNETLLDLKPLEKSIDSILLEEGAEKRWFATMLQY